MIRDRVTDERYVAELYLGESSESDATELTVLLPLDFEIA